MSPMSAMTTGMLAFSARLSTLGAVEESVRQIRMPASCKACFSRVRESTLARSICGVYLSGNFIREAVIR